MNNPKYKLTKDSITIGTTKLYRIQALRDFGSVKKGELGGYVEAERNLSHKGAAWVSGNARVSGDALVSGNARVSGYAWVSDGALVTGDAKVSKPYHIQHHSGLKYVITVTPQNVSVGCRLWTHEDFGKLKYSEVKSEVTVREFKKYMLIIPILIKLARSR